MTIKQLVYLLPSRTIEDLSLERSNDDAEAILSAWTGLFHPALLAAADSTPYFVAADDPPEQLDRCLIVVPPCCESQLPVDWLSRAEANGAALIRGQKERSAITAAAMAAAGLDSTQAHSLAAEFFALAYCHFLVEMLTRQLRYMTNLDEVSYRIAALAAAHAAVRGDQEEATKELDRAFSLLQQAREYFYPVESHLIDLTVVAPTTIGAELTAELQSSTPLNLLITGRTLRLMAQENPTALALLRKRWEEGSVGIVGGEEDEPPLSLLRLESAALELDCGLAVFEQLLGRRPTVFGRRRFGLTPVLPQVLLSRGFVGTLHSALDDGRFPTGNQSRIRWEGADGSGIEAIARVPLDVGQPAGFMRLPELLGSSMDLDHIATVVFAHWPGQTCCWYEDLKRIVRHTSVVGDFCTVETYFTRTGSAAQSVRHKPDGYRAPYLAQAVAAEESDPISRWIDAYRAREAVERVRAVRTLEFACGGDDVIDRKQLEGWEQQADRLADRCDAASRQQLLNELETAVRMATERFAHRTASVAKLDTVETTGAARSYQAGLLIINPCSQSDVVRVDAAPLPRLPIVSSPVVAAGTDEVGADVLVETPAMGFAYVAAGPADAPATAVRRRWFFRRRSPVERPIVTDNVLENEFFQVVIDRRFGGIRAVLDPLSRGPRLAQQLALRWPEGDPNDPGHESHYTIPAADELRIVRNGPIVGEILCRGRMMDHQGRVRGRFSQRTRVVRGSRVIELDIEIEPTEMPSRQPWQSYYAARFAWSDETATLRRSVHGMSMATEASQIEAPEFWEVLTAKTRTTIFTGGLPYHRKVGYRRMDTLLIVAGESRRRFRMAIGVECPSPAALARRYLGHPLVVPCPSPLAASHGWLFHIEGTSITASGWSPLSEYDQLGSDAGSLHRSTTDHTGGSVRGVRVRLCETEGKNVRFGIRAPTTLKTACRRYAGHCKELPIDGDRVEVELPAYGWCELEMQFA